jgi:hypothetical protein
MVPSNLTRYLGKETMIPMQEGCGLDQPVDGLSLLHWEAQYLGSNSDTGFERRDTNSKYRMSFEVPAL